MESVAASSKTNIFDEFTGKYSLSKTLRFELKPVGKTQDNASAMTLDI